MIYQYLEQKANWIVIFGNLNDWRKISELVPKEFMTKNFIKTGLAGIFSASLELSKEGKINIMQKKLFDYVLIKERKTWQEKIKK